jgi:hypothetical protein
MQNDETKEAKKALDELFLSPDTIIKKAKKYAEDSSFLESEKEIPYYYLIVKIFIAEHESRFGTIPIQIYNEHRMALDHLVRAKKSYYDKNTKNAIGHLRRALLDIVKLNCAGLRREIDKRQATIPKKALGLISNGDYIKSYIGMQNEAEDLLNKARSDDHKIGDDIEINKSIVNLFVKAYVAHCDWYRFQAKNMGNALYIKTKYYIITGLPLIISFLLGLMVNYIYDCLK